MKKTFSKTLIAAALALPVAAFAAVTPITFDVNGAAVGGSYTIDLLDWAPGNALAIGGAPFGGVSAGYETQLLYQANLATASLDGEIAFAASGSEPRFSVVAGVKEQVISNVAGSVSFTMDDAATLDSTNFFYIYANTSNGDNLTGLGFTAGSIIMSGHIASIRSSNYTTNGSTGVFDGVGTNNYPAIMSIIGSGSTDLVVQIDSFDANYFPDLSLASLAVSFTNTSQVTPFSQVNPSSHFSSNGIANGDVLSNTGPVNGANFTDQRPYNFQFQADGNSSFQVPEPDSLALFGLTLGLLSFVGRRNGKKA